MSKEADVTIRGKLDAVHPAKLMAGFFEARKTGLLTFKDGPTRLLIHLCDGSVVCDRSIVMRDRGFWQYLVTRGFITPDELIKYSHRAKETSSEFIELLVQNGAVERSDIENVSEEFYWKSVPMLFSWKRGEYAFSERSVTPRGERPTPMAGARFIVEGVIDKYDPMMIKDRLAQRMDTKLKASPIKDLDVDTLGRAFELLSVVNAVRNNETPRSIVEKHVGDRTRAMAFLFVMLTLGAAKFDATGKRRPRRAVSSPFDRLFDEASKSVDRIRGEVSKGGAGQRELDVRLADLDADGASPEQLEARLQRLLEIKRLRREMLDEDADTVSPAEPGSAASDIPEIPDEESKGSDEEDAAFSFDSDEEQPTIAPGDDLSSLTDFATDGGDFSFPDDDAMADGDGFPGDFGDPAGSPENYVRFGPEDSVDSILSAMKGFCDESRWQEAEMAYAELNVRGYEGADAMAYAGWARYHVATEDPFAAGAGLIQKAIQRNPKMDLPYLLMGRIYLEEDDNGMAELYFVRAIEVNSDCFEAKEHIRKIYGGR